MFGTVLDRGKGRFRGLIFAVICLAIVMEVEATRVLIVDRLVELSICMQMEVAVLMVLLSN